MFTNYIIVVENETWLNAMARSRDYVRNFFGKIFSLVALGSILMLLVNSVLNQLKLLPEGSLLSFVLSVLITPIYLIYFFLIYAHLRKLKPVSSISNKKFMQGIVWAGLLVILVIIGLIVYYAPQIGSAIETYNLKTTIPVGIKLQ